MSNVPNLYVHSENVLPLDLGLSLEHSLSPAGSLSSAVPENHHPSASTSAAHPNLDHNHNHGDLLFPTSSPTSPTSSLSVSVPASSMSSDLYKSTASSAPSNKSSVSSFSRPRFKQHFRTASNTIKRHLSPIKSSHQHHSSMSSSVSDSNSPRFSRSSISNTSPSSPVSVDTAMQSNIVSNNTPRPRILSHIGRDTQPPLDPNNNSNSNNSDSASIKSVFSHIRAPSLRRRPSKIDTVVTSASSAVSTLQTISSPVSAHHISLDTSASEKFDQDNKEVINELELPSSWRRRGSSSPSSPTVIAHNNNNNNNDYRYNFNKRNSVIHPSATITNNKNYPSQHSKSFSIPSPVRRSPSFMSSTTFGSLLSPFIHNDRNTDNGNNNSHNNSASSDLTTAHCIDNCKKDDNMLFAPAHPTKRGSTTSTISSRNSSLLSDPPSEAAIVEAKRSYKTQARAVRLYARPSYGSITSMSSISHSAYPDATESSSLDHYSQQQHHGNHHITGQNSHPYALGQTLYSLSHSYSSPPLSTKSSYVNFHTTYNNTPWSSFSYDGPNDELYDQDLVEWLSGRGRQHDPPPMMHHISSSSSTNLLQTPPPLPPSLQKSIRGPTDMKELTTSFFDWPASPQSPSVSTTPITATSTTSSSATNTNAKTKPPLQRMSSSPYFSYQDGPVLPPPSRKQTHTKNLSMSSTSAVSKTTSSVLDMSTSPTDTYEVDLRHSKTPPPTSPPSHPPPLPPVLSASNSPAANLDKNALVPVSKPIDPEMWKSISINASGEMKRLRKNRNDIQKRKA